MSCEQQSRIYLVTGTVLGLVAGMISSPGIPFPLAIGLVLLVLVSGAFWVNQSDD